jgi:hypothetical protein
MSKSAGQRSHRPLRARELRELQRPEIQWRELDWMELGRLDPSGRRQELPPQRGLVDLARGLATFLTELPRHMDNFTNFLHRLQRRAEKDEWRYLLDQLDPLRGLFIAAALELADGRDVPIDESIANLIEDGYTEQALIDRLKSEVDASPASWSRNEQLLAGIEFATEKRHHLAVPLLLNALEGAFWRTAETQGLVEQDRKGKWLATAKTRKPGRKLGGIESVIWLQELDLDEPFRRFLVGLVYGGSGNPYRHGSAEEGWRVRSLCLIASLIGWLELNGQIDARREVRAAFRRLKEDEDENEHSSGHTT